MSQTTNSFALNLDLVPYEFTRCHPTSWECNGFTAFDLKVKSRFTENYEGKLLRRKNGEDVFLYVCHHDCDSLKLSFSYEIPLEEQIDLIEEFFGVYFDGLREIGFEVLDPQPK